ncbi:MAG: lipocalin family protein [Cyclobacteriaceae bacterium]|nr:lipocalin family protein [Cyclobacteriaceae bacterium]
MKTRIFLLLSLMAVASMAQGQSIIGTWQVVEEKTCFEAQMPESETEKELLKDMGSTRNAVAKVITFKKNGTGEEGIFTTGKKKGTDKTTFTYRLTDSDLKLMDKKSGIMTQQLVVDELTATTLRFHLAGKDCETKTLTRIK